MLGGITTSTELMLLAERGAKCTQHFHSVAGTNNVQLDGLSPCSAERTMKQPRKTQGL